MGLQTLRFRGHPGRDIRPLYEQCFQIANEAVWDECREHAHRLASAAVPSSRGVWSLSGQSKVLWTGVRHSSSGFLSADLQHGGSLSRAALEWICDHYEETFLRLCRIHHVPIQALTSSSARKKRRSRYQQLS